MNEKVPPTASNRRKKELAGEGDLVTYKRKRKTIDPSTVVPPNTVDSKNEGVSEGVNIPTESAEGVNIPKGSEFETESAQAGLGAQPPLPNICPDLDENIPIFGGYSEGEGATSGDDVGPRGAGISLSLKKLKSHYAFKLEKVLSDGTAAVAKKKKGLTTRSIARAYMLYVLGSFLFPTKKGTDVSICYLFLFGKDKVAKKWPWGSAVLAHMYYNLGTASRDDSWIFAHFPKLGGIPKEMDSDAYEYYDSGIYQRKPVSVNEHGDTPVHQSEDIAEQYDALTSECDLLKETIEQMKAEIELKRVVDEQCALEFADLPRQLDTKILECKNLEEKNTSLEAELRSKSGLEDCNQSLSFVLNKKIESLKAVNSILMEQIDMQLPPATPLVVLQSHQPVPDTTLAKKYEDLLAAHEDIKKKLIVKEDFHKKLVNSEERKKTLEVDNNEWEVWRQALKKVFASEGMGDMGDPTFEELFVYNERFFTIAQQGPKGDYQEDLVSTAVTLDNVVIAWREKMAKKKMIQELLFQPWTKYLVNVHSVEISDNNFGFRVTATIQHQSQHRFPDLMKSLKTFLYKNPAFWKSIFSQTLGIQFTADGENAYQILLQVCSYGHQHVEYRHMAHLLDTYYEKVVVFISHTEAYTFLPLFWARKRNTTSNEERFQNLVMDTSKYWWFGLGVDNHFVRLFPRFDAPIPLLFTIFYSHVNLEIPPGFIKEQLTRYFDVRVRNFKALLREHKCQGYRVNDMVTVGLSTIK
ncbi:hypothetical protein GIB67_027313 [Kingdonia uniflora]|uniref:Aminotransferase-like plant mobile domain-containing protein n=1 Tax=Kingdonia uniflora TaxID=39325 RepID=A0A7J7KYL5_9MAGN|nr:hypothetical protein GIB67_027313 [Kingdonia uniflora]